MTTESPLKSRYWDTASATLDVLREYNFSPVPEVFHVWFVYFADENPDIFRALDLARQQGTPIEEKQLFDLYQRFILHPQMAEFLLQGMDDFADVVDHSEHSIGSVSTELTVYGNVLEEVGAVLQQGGKKMEILNLVARQTRHIRQSVTALSDQLETYHQKIADLQVELQKAREQSFTDGLTRVSNRLHFEQLLNGLAGDLDTEASNQPFCLLMIDLDQFKQINDRFGHRVGDEILVLLAGILKSSVKGRDTVARYGGDEFAVLLPQSRLDEAKSLAQELCSSVRGREVRAKSSGTSFGHMTVSIGVAEYQKGEGAASLIDRTDAALYQAKEAGRDQYSVAFPLSDTVEPAGC